MSWEMAIASVVTTTSWYSPPLVPGSCSRKPWNPYPKSLSIRFNARRGRLKLRAQRSLALDAEKEWENGRTVDVAVIGAGIGGLCCAAMLAKYGLSVVVCESHDTAGGAAHAFIRQGFHFDSGPSFHAGLSTKPSINPLKQVLDAIDEQVQCVQYDTWIGYFPEGIFKFTADKAAYAAEITRVGGQKAGCEWKELERAMEPFSRAAASLPAAALRQDLGVLLTVGRFLPRLLPYIPYTGSLLAPFSDMVDKIVKDPFLRKLIDLECFVLSGLLADGTITAEMTTMFMERHRADGTIDYPLGGGQSIIEALLRGLRKYGGQVLLSSHVDKIITQDGRAVGIEFRKTRGPGKGEKMVLNARKAVVSNASVWDTARLLPDNEQFHSRAVSIPKTDSFMHLHLGIEASGLPDDLECHHLVLNDWSVGINAPQNVCIVSIPTVFDPSLAPPGHHVVHAYTAGNEPYDIWRGMDQKSAEYATQKEVRSEVLWKALEKVIPDIRRRVKLKLVGSPLTHERYLRRSEGTYGPAIKAGEMSFPGPQTNIPGLICCGDSTMPGIGVPAVAASGLIAAHSIVPVWDQLRLLNSIGDAI
ncbi:hypothetical protein KP509_23G052400 [Ceratopteris richardii]|uniref:Amine oxidase domain-containing protein n=1 Tax=Ceratopteris richardii TaxID=49495 RepID=A0A8T2RZU3_CERRI|nr:hypothetical protein KP509_23G052400 [Ceratopteris richardii]